MSKSCRNLLCQLVADLRVLALMAGTGILNREWAVHLLLQTIKFCQPDPGPATTTLQDRNLPTQHDIAVIYMPLAAVWTRCPSWAGCLVRSGPCVL